MTIKYNFGQLESLSQDIANNSKLVQNHNSELLGFVNGLRATWTSEAQDRYTEVQDRWQRAHEDLINTLSDISKTVLEASQHMGDRDRTNANVWH